MTWRSLQRVQILLAILVFLSMHPVLSAQDMPETGIQAVWLNVNFTIGLPQQVFRDRLDATGFGVGGNVLVDLPRRPLQVGLDWSYTGYEKEKLDLEIDVGGFFEDFDLITRNNIFQTYGQLRFEPPVNYFLRPYVDGLVGFKLLYTRTRLINRDNSEEGVVESNTNQHDWSFSYGGAVGLKIYLLESVAVDLRCAYLPGDNASFLAKRPNADQLNIEDTIDAFEEKRSPTHLLLPQIGITVDLIGVEYE